MRPVFVLVLLAWGALSPAALGAQAPPAQEPPAYRQVFPQPTGKNGYEQLVLAGDLVRGHAAFRRATLGTPTLAEKRALAADRTLQRAVSLVRAGLARPVISPRREISFSTTLPELGAMRDVGRLLAMLEYVHLADGRPGEALETLRLGLAFARAIQMDTLVQGLVGVAVTAVVLRPVTSRLDQLSARDCTRLQEICLEWLAQPSPYLAVLSGEWRGLRSSLVEMRDRALRDGPEKAAGDLLDPDGGPQVARVLPRDAAALDQMLAEVGRRADQYFLKLQEEVRKEPWERRPVQVDETGPAGAMLALLVPAHQQTDAAYTRDSARLRLLALHAAIRRYQWEYDRLPPNLAALNPGTLARDPFTGEPFEYQVRGARYTLTSVGPTARDPNDPQAVNGRVPSGSLLTIGRSRGGPVTGLAPEHPVNHWRSPCSLPPQPICPTTRRPPTASGVTTKAACTACSTSPATPRRKSGSSYTSPRGNPKSGCAPWRCGATGSRSTSGSPPPTIRTHPCECWCAARGTGRTRTPSSGSCERCRRDR